MSSSGTNRPYKYGAGDRREFIVHECEVEIRAQNDASGNVIYLGTAKAGSAEGDPKWQISFQTWDGSNALTSKTWPQDASGNPSTNYEFVWTNRATYTYA